MLPDINTHTATLPSGMRLLTMERPGTSLVTVGIAIAAGTRHEQPQESGMAHLVEHMTFKGTARRTAAQVARRMDSVGADLGAFTGKEETVFYCTCLPEHQRRATELLTDIVFHSTYPEAELEHEVDVVCDEIDLYLDTPTEQIFDDFEAHLFSSSPLGRNILGDASLLRHHTAADLRAFAARHYRPEQALMFVAGPKATKATPPPWQWERRGADSSDGTSAQAHQPARAHTEAGTQFSHSRDTTGSTSETIIHRPSHQAHVVIGGRAFAMSDPQKAAARLLLDVLGGPALSSRLGTSLRERRGLVYTVDASLTTYTDTGYWAVYFGCDPADARRCRRLVMNELQRLTTTPLAPRTLRAAVTALKGRMAVAAADTENAAIAIAKRYLHTGQVVTTADIATQLDQLTPEQLLTTAQALFSKADTHTLAYMP